MTDVPVAPDPPADLHPFAQAAVDAHERLAPKLAEHRKQHVTDVLHQLESDLAPLVGPVVQRLLDNPGAADELKALLGEAVEPGHQFGSLVIGFAIGSIVGPALGAALAPEIEVIERNAWALNPTRPTPPDIAVASVLKGVVDEPTGAAEAVKAGYNDAVFHQMVQAAGQSIGIQEALLLFRRGQITLEHLTEIVRYSNVNPRFYDDVPKLQYVPPTVGESITGALKHHLPPDVARAQVGHAGVDPSHFDWLLASAGRPLGLEQTLHLWNRGVVDEAFVDQSIAQSDINDAWTDAAKELRHYFPPPRSIVPMLRNGAITETQARTLLTYYGVDTEWADAFVAEALHTSGTTVKELTSAQVTRLYEARLIDRPTAAERLTALRYPPADVDLLLRFADDARHERLLNATITKVGTLYVGHKLDRTGAVAALNDAAVPVAAQHDLFALWDVQRDANLHVPTVAGIVGAFRRGTIDALETRQRLLQLGVDVNDLAIFVADGWPPSHPVDANTAAAAVIQGLGSWYPTESATPPAPKRLTVAQVQNLYEAGTIGATEATADLTALGYTPAQAAQLLSTFTPPKPPSTGGTV